VTSTHFPLKRKAHLPHSLTLNPFTAAAVPGLVSLQRLRRHRALFPSGTNPRERSSAPSQTSTRCPALPSLRDTINQKVQNNLNQTKKQNGVRRVYFQTPFIIVNVTHQTCRSIAHAVVGLNCDWDWDCKHNERGALLAYLQRPSDCAHCAAAADGAAYKVSRVRVGKGGREGKVRISVLPRLTSPRLAASRPRSCTRTRTPSRSRSRRRPPVVPSADARFPSDALRGHMRQVRDS
jgi:hypothetical protein